MTASKKHLKPKVVNAGANVSATQPGTPKISAKLMSEYKAVTATIEAERAAKERDRLGNMPPAQVKKESLYTLYKDGDDGPMEAKPISKPKTPRTPKADTPLTPSSNSSNGTSKTKVKPSNGKTQTTYTKEERDKILAASRKKFPNIKR